MTSFNYSTCWWSVVLLLCILGSKPVLSLRCYVCDSLGKPECGDYFRVYPSEASNCFAGSRCVKFRALRGSGWFKTPEVYRYCSYEFLSNGCRTHVKNGLEGEACPCMTDLCNTASPVTTNWAVSLVSSVLVICKVYYS